MKRILLLLLFVCFLTACGASATVPDRQTTSADLPSQAEMTEEPVREVSNMLRLTIGENTILAELTDNAASRELSALLQSGPITMSASNYGGFEKVCALGTRLTSDDVQTTTQPGDIMLYSSSQVVIFYGSNSWAYTRLAKVVEKDIPRLRDILSGSETEVVLELA